MPLKESIRQQAEALYGEVRDIRRHIHAHPELSFQEENTAAFIENKLQAWGIPHQRIAGTGILAHIEGRNPGKKTIALRSDHDALPIQEKNEVPYCSTNPGVMHACGHDVHTASLLGAANILNQYRNEFEGTIRLIFQPGEEKLPGGASLVIKEGGLENPKPEAIIAQHVTNEIAAGKVGFRPGLYMASTDEIYVTVKGKGGHGAMPQQNIDPVLIAAHMIVALQQLVSRWADPRIPTVLSFGKVIANGATNVIPNEVQLEGTFRTFDEEWRKEAHHRMKSMAEGLVESMGGQVDFVIENGYPFLKNDAALTEYLMKAAAEYLGPENIVPLDIRPTAEDFAFYSHHVPACFYRLGTGNKDKSITAAVHNARFDIDEEALKVGSGLLAWLAIKELEA